MLSAFGGRNRGFTCRMTVEQQESPPTMLPATHNTGSVTTTSSFTSSLETSSDIASTDTSVTDTNSSVSPQTTVQQDDQTSPSLIPESEQCGKVLCV